MKVKILGCGSSNACPVIGCKCKVCKSLDIKNRRTRSSIFFNFKDSNIIIDTGPDLYSQSINHNLEKLDAVLYTHAHYDHIGGIDELRQFNYLNNKVIPAFGDQETMDYLERSYKYIFEEKLPGSIWYKPQLKKNIIPVDSCFYFNDIKIETIKLPHGNLNVVGYKIGNLAYIVDTTFLSDYAFEILKNIDLLIIACLGYKESASHPNYHQVMEWLSKINAKKTVLTHMSHEIDYHEISTKLPINIIAAYDGLELKING